MKSFSNLWCFLMLLLVAGLLVSQGLAQEQDPAETPAAKETPAEEDPAEEESAEGEEGEEASDPNGFNFMPSDDLDDDLFKQLTDGLPMIEEEIPELEEEATEEPQQPEPAETTETRPTGKAKKPQDGLTRSLVEELEADIENDDEESPLFRLGKQMQEVQRLIAKANSGDQTQQAQQQIVKELDEMLKRMQSRCENKGQNPQQAKQPSQQPSERSEPSSQPPSHQKGDAEPQNPTEQENRNPNDSSERLPPEEYSETESATSPEELARMVESVWGHLPERQREVLIQAFKQKYLPRYEALIKAYYSRLARERME
ncbi:Hypothetical protein PBC10988_13270 [Planctomycetales bacterium 10988]|nr:Hypothetical protein PBC10988_13270 [Planctomycetales bacterium 10988]